MKIAVSCWIFCLKKPDNMSNMLPNRVLEREFCTCKWCLKEKKDCLKGRLILFLVMHSLLQILQLHCFLMFDIMLVYKPHHHHNNITYWIWQCCRLQWKAWKIQCRLDQDKTILNSSGTIFNVWELKLHHSLKLLLNFSC